MSDIKNILFCCDLLVTEDAVEKLWGLLALHISFGWEEESLPTGETRFRFYCENEDFINTVVREVQAMVPLVSVEVSQVPQEDWTLAWREYFTPIACGAHFMVLPPWLADTTELDGRQSIIIEPKSAFGTGHHSTTALCLKVISQLLEQGRITKGMEFLDLGTGSGILGIGCCHLGLYGIGTDIDPLAVDNALENRALNNISNYDAENRAGFDIVLGSVEVVAGRKFDLVVANILANPLKELAPALVALRKNDGCLILSGLLVIQAEDVQKYYMKQNLPAPSLITEGEWAALVWQ